MKKLLIFLCGIFICVICFADTINLAWKVDNALYDTSTCTTGGDLILPTTPTKYGYTFTGWEFAKMQPVEYLESTGTQVILIPFNSVQGIRIETIYEFIDITNYPVVISLFDGRIGGIFSDQVDPNGTWLIYFNRTGIRTGRAISANKKYVSTTNMVSGNSFYSVDGTIIASYLQQYSIGTGISLFASYNTERGLYNKSKVKIYEVQIYDTSDNLLYHLIPVLDTSGVPCMYDKVTEQYFYNAGTGQFIAGPVLNE